MPVSFRRLAIAGFKSFADPVSIDIRPGLTGIVGPNGCGKSNVVEALRWAMGESSARNLRGGEMDDVIFAGTSGRGARSLANVTVYLEDTEGVAPPPFHEQAQLQIERAIARGSGSIYRVNGQEARARDVQTLFADLASGSRASAMVSQGRVGALVGARPEDRRGVLDEAAGITGLYARRHEAELKLRAAEANLSRAEDARTQMTAQLDGLKRQARQAARYRTLSATIRATEAEMFAIQVARANDERVTAKEARAAADLAAAAALEAASQAGTLASEAAGRVPPLREREAQARTALERHRVSQEQIAAEEQRARSALADAERRLGQLRQDVRHAEQFQHDAAEAEARLAAEDAVLAASAAFYPAREAACEAACVLATDSVRAAEATANQATEAAAEANAQANAAAQALAQADQRARRLQEQWARVQQDRDRLAAQLVAPASLARAAEDVAQAEASVAAARAALDQAEQHRARTAAVLSTAQEALSAAETARARLAAEAQALQEVLAVKDGERWPPMVDALTVPAGLESALGAVLGEELTSALNPGAARHWRALPAFDPVPDLPPGATPLHQEVQGPSLLGRVLSQIGLVEDDATGEANQARLAPGQVLVSREGAIWRWDGYTIRAGTPTPATVRLRQRNRLAELRQRLTEAEATAATARGARQTADAASREAAQAEQQARTVRRDLDQRLERARAALGALRTQATTAATRHAALNEQVERIGAEREETEAAVARARANQAGLPDIKALRATVDQARATAATARTREQAARGERDALARDQAARTSRRTAIAAERAGWHERARDAAGRVTDLAARLAAAEAEQGSLAAEPDRVTARRAEAREALAAAEGEHRRASGSLTAAVGQQTESDRAARSAESALAVRREQAVRAEAAERQADHAWGTVAERVLERLGARPQLPDAPEDVSQQTEDKIRRRLDRLQRERSDMGPVNLRAEVEVAELEQRVALIESERQDLATAIARLRGSIGHLNREGRERLNTVFQEVDRHFQQLFTHMFGGGRAHLSLVGSDDPLEAGLEIYAQPPGKKLAALSLLSGGEQALTALSLIFAVFRCNPAPICVLDEVDAPLDDANVDRFCGLLEEMVRETRTRFLVVTHHPLTMARMDRLYGVTMQERGVSRLLSVDLARASAMVDDPRLAAE